MQCNERFHNDLQASFPMNIIFSAFVVVSHRTAHDLITARVGHSVSPVGGQLTNSTFYIKTVMPFQENIKFPIFQCTVNIYLVRSEVSGNTLEKELTILIIN